MKRLLFFFILLSNCELTKAQDYLGLSTGNYAGILGIQFQPANVADNRYKFDINLVSTSFNFQNNYLGFSRSYFINNRFSFKDFENYRDFKNKVLTENTITGNNVYFNVNNRLNLPSVLITTGIKSGIALNFQSRTSLAVDHLNPDLAKQVFNLWEYTPTYNKAYDASGLNINALNWFEAGLTYGRVFIENGKHFLKAGATVKYLGGVSSLYYESDDLTIKATSDSALSMSSPYIKYGHSATNISSQIINNYKPDASALGYDLGVVYEFRGRIDEFNFLKFESKAAELVDVSRRDKNKYSAKLGLSILDIGMLKFKSAPLARDFSANINNFNINSMNVNNVQDFDSLLFNLPGITLQGKEGKEYSVAMPTALSAQLDLHLLKGFYVNAMAYLPFKVLNNNADFRTFTPKYYAVTPRWENRVVGVYVPFILNKYKNEGGKIRAGATLRVGPVFVGTSNMLTLLSENNIQNADLHAGFKIPIAYGKPSKATQWLKDLTYNKEIETKPIEKMVIEEEAPSSKQVPIQIIINNYGAGNVQPNDHQQIIEINPNTKDVKQKDVILDDQGRQIMLDDKEDADLYNLQDQIDYLKFKLRQKQQLIEQLEKQQNSPLDELGKKKIESLIHSYLNDQTYTPLKMRLDNNAHTLSFYKAAFQQLANRLNNLDELNKSADKKIQDLLERQDVLITQNTADTSLARLQKEIHSELTALAHYGPKPLRNRFVSKQSSASVIFLDKKQLIIDTLHSNTRTSSNSFSEIGKEVEKKPQEFRSRTSRIETIMVKPKNTERDIRRTKNSLIELDTANLFTKRDAGELSTKKEIQSLQEEIVALKATLEKLNKNSGTVKTEISRPILNIDSNLVVTKKDLVELITQKDYVRLQEENRKVNIQIKANQQNNLGGNVLLNNSVKTMDSVSKEGKPESINLKQYQEYSRLQGEIRSLKEDLANSRKKIKKKRIWTLFDNNTDLSIDGQSIAGDTVVPVIPDTVYVNRPVEKIVNEVIYDTVIQIMEKDSVITKTEIKEITIDNTVDKLLQLPALYILFDVNSTVVKNYFQKKIDFYILQLHQYPELRVELKGHTDNTGKVDNNLFLSQKRAQEVSYYFMQNGIQENRIISIGVGASDPVTDNASSSGKSQNRRVEIRFIK